MKVSICLVAAITYLALAQGGRLLKDGQEFDYKSEIPVGTGKMDYTPYLVGSEFRMNNLVQTSNSANTFNAALPNVKAGMDPRHMNGDGLGFQPVPKTTYNVLKSWAAMFQIKSGTDKSNVTKGEILMFKSLPADGQSQSVVRYESSKNKYNILQENGDNVEPPNHMLNTFDIRNMSTNALTDGAWKSLAMTVFCGTRGDRYSKARAVREALQVSYPSNTWVVFVTETSHGWAYSTTDWDPLVKTNLCGDWYLLVFGRPSKPCKRSVDKAAALLQKGALTDANSLIEARDLMKSRETVYDLHYDLVLVFGSGAWTDIVYQHCTDVESTNGMTSLWSGDVTD